MKEQYLDPGTLLQGGKYEIVRHLASGGFGNTYEAMDVNLNKKVAVKEFFVKDFCTRDSNTTMVLVTTASKKALISHLKHKFIDEARAIASMEHENIIKVQTLFEENDTAYYVMDYIDGESLNDLIKKRGPFPEDEAIAIIKKVAGALGYMHEQGRFHLDVKPGNIMMRKDGKVILIDFGSSKQYAEVGGENTAALTPCYTPGYAPAEQMHTKATEFTAASDVYALGATLYKLLTGLTPPSAIDLLNDDETLSYPGTLSEATITVIERSMIPQRSKRLQTTSEFTQLLNDETTETSKAQGDKQKFWWTKEELVPVSVQKFVPNFVSWFFVLLLLVLSCGIIAFLIEETELLHCGYENELCCMVFCLTFLMGLYGIGKTRLMPNRYVKRKKELEQTDFMESIYDSTKFVIVARGDAQKRKYGVFDVKKLRLVVPFKYDSMKWNEIDKTLIVHQGNERFVIDTQDNVFR
ncbi:MAG: serine/threonine protein kinase [Muribaculaceae bacterium]|nr:serine/threonine protein kinase [Muribaculaceae bacterium]